MRAGRTGLGLLLTLLLGAAVVRAAEQATVTAQSLYVRSGPSLAYPARGILGRGARVEVLERQEGWLKVARGALEGYIRWREDCVIFAAAPETRDAAVAAAAPPAAGDAREIARRIEVDQDALQDYTRREGQTIERLDALERSLNESRREAARIKGDLLRIEGQIAATAGRLSALNQRVRQAEGQAAARMAALYKLGRLGRISLLATAGSVYDLLIRERNLERVLRQDDTLLARLAADQAEARQQAAHLQEQRSAQIRLQETLKERVATLAAEGRQRQQLLAQIRDRRELTLASLDALRQAAAALERQIQSFEGEPPAAAQGPPTPPFAARKGVLGMPVQGEVIAGFGPFRNRRYNVVNFRSGIDIRADRGEPIHAVGQGRVLFSNWFKGYGNMLILDHGDNYCTVYAHLEELFKEQGSSVEAGEVIATVGDSGSGEGPKLYFEVRHHGKPLDPMDWIRRG
jgi:septal ring factor EnvC (AmiA/AmiB activator)